MKTTPTQLLSEKTDTVSRMERTRRSRMSRATALFASMAMAFSPVLPSIAQAAEHGRAQTRVEQAQKAMQVESKLDSTMGAGVDSKLLEHNKRVLEAQQLMLAGKANAELTVVPETKVSKTAKGGTRYTAGLVKGEIGASQQGDDDNPRDNVFHIDIKEMPKGTQWAWLSYYVNGVRDDAGVARSINDQAAEGGQLIKGSNQWIFIREAVNPDWLKEGQNIVRFAKTGKGYRVKDVSIDIEPVDKKTVKETLLVVNQPGISYDGKVLIKGYVTGPAAKTARVRIADHEFSLHNGGFSDVMDVAKLKALAGKNQDEAAETIDVIADVATKTSAGKQRMERIVAKIKVTGDIQADSLMSIDNPGKTRYASKANTSETLALGSARIELTASAKTDKHISVTALRQVDIPAMNQGMVNLTSKHKGYRFLPHGSKFSEPQTVRLGYDKDSIPDGFTAHDIQTYYFSEDQGKWLALNRVEVDEKTQTIVSTTDHFTDMINAVAKTPDMPETSALTPTTFKNMKAANPSSQVNMIQAPGANNQGDANLSYPLQLPAGRNGMTPSLAVSYSSSAQNSWMGMGWNLSVPSIGIDTRWGVPRYDAATETETYSFAGQQLAPVAHRSEPVARQSEKQFYPRVEGSFSKIIRHGSSPDTYYWEVTDKSGTRHFFGGTQNGLRDDAVLRTRKGNIGHWALAQTLDPYGNSVNYTYEKPPIRSAVGVAGKELYLKKVDYTGFNGTQGKYSVTFDRDQTRVDTMIDARLGFKRVTEDLLSKATVKYQDQVVRSYEFKYITGAFNKSLLKTITQNDSKGAKFNSHNFDYFNDVQDSSNNYKPFNGENNWTVPTGQVSDVSSLGGNKGRNKGKNFSVSFGLWDNQANCKSATIGLNKDRNKSNTDGLLALVDINGDGLSDKVIKQGDQLAYQANLSGATSKKQEFASPQLIRTRNQFYKDMTNSSTTGLQINPFTGCQPLSISLGRSVTRSVYKSDVYFSDVNGDGLIDIAANGEVYFNHLDSNSQPVFTKGSEVTPNPILTGVGAKISREPLTQEQQLALQKANPLHDTVRVWKAPYTGSIQIAAPVTLKAFRSDVPEQQTEYDNDDLKDGVIVSVQHKNAVLWSSELTNFSTVTPGINTINVVKGDKVYFRTHSIDNGRYDQVEWNPSITYTSYPATVDANGLQQYQFNAANDFTLSGRTVPVVALPIDGNINVTSQFTKAATSDDVRVQVVLKNAQGTQQIVFDRQLSQSASSLPISFNQFVNSGSQIEFKVFSDTEIDWKQISWNPVVKYTSANDSNVNNSLATEEGQEALTFPAVPFMSMYQYKVKETAPVAVISSGRTSVSPQLSFNTGNVSGTVTFAVKVGQGGLGRTLRKKTVRVNNGLVADSLDAVVVNVQQGQALYVEVFADNSALADALANSSANITFSNLSTVTVPMGVSGGDTSMLFGSLYRGWGQFVYNGNIPWNTQAIDESVLKIDSSIMNPGPLPNLNSQAEIDAFADSDANPINSRFVMMLPDNTIQGYKGYDVDNYVKETEVSSTRFGAKDLKSVNPVPSDTARAVVKIIETEDTSYSLGASVGVGGAGLTKSNSQSRTISEFMDMNGDRYPDVLGESTIQFTDMLGRLVSDPKNTELEEPRLSATEGKSINVSGGFARTVYTFSENAGMVANMAVQGNAGVSGNNGSTIDESDYGWVDVNGDGLPDRVYKDGRVALNLGYDFDQKLNWGYDSVREANSQNKGLGGSAGFNLGAFSLAGGINISESSSVIQRTLMDVNADGLPDAVTVGDTLSVRLNTGSGFAQAVPWNGVEKTNLSVNTSRNGNATLTGCIPLVPPLPVAKLCIGGGGNKSKNTSKDLVSLSDIDGDGYLDVMRSDNETDLRVQTSTIGRTNMLRQVTRPMGSVINLDYNREGNTYAMPQNKWVLNKVEVVDRVAKNGANRFLNTFSYADGYHDRREREFYGFAKVVSNQHDTTAANDVLYRTTEQIFNNDSYYFKGLVTEEVLKDAAGAEWTKSTYDYDLKQVGDQPVPVENGSFAFDANSAFPALSKKQMFFYEGTGSAGKETSEEYGYDAYGNVTTFKDLGDTGGDDDITAEITYFPPSNFTYYTANVPQQIRVTGGNGDLLRERSTQANVQGDMTRISQNTGGVDRAVYNMDYDSYGNIKTMTNPANLAGQRMRYTYEYEGDLNTYVSKITDSFGYSSGSNYDYLWGAVKDSTDMNGHKTVTTYDSVGRVSTVTGPKELASGAPYSIQMSYDPSETGVPSATTKHHDSEPSNDTLDTITLSDSLGRVIQTKKDGSIFTGKGQVDDTVMIVSGYVEFDGLGRTITSYYPTTEAKGTNTGFNAAKDSVAPTTTTYDVLDRALSVTLPDGAVTKTAYGFGSDRSGTQQFETTVTDAEGVQKQSYTDVDGSITSIKEFNKGQTIWTSYAYDAINQLTKVTDDKNNVTTSTYDLLGRRTALNNPDTGLTSYQYDAASNMVALQTANLRAKGEDAYLRYFYDYNRVKEVLYPYNTDQNVEYFYGKPGDKFNRAGKVALVQDSTGATDYQYGNMGEVTQEKRTLVDSLGYVRTYVQKNVFDTWGRIREMTYPDGEKVTYRYNVGGNLNAISGYKLGHDWLYVKQLGYDKFEQRAYLRYGNETDTYYNYDNRRRLNKLKVTAKDVYLGKETARKLMENTYEYDKVSNVKLISDVAAPKRFNQRGTGFTQTFEYDDLYRMTKSNANYLRATSRDRFSVSMEYDSIHNIKRKTQKHENSSIEREKWREVKRNTYDNIYQYQDVVKAHAPSVIGNTGYAYDANGNIVARQPGSKSPKEIDREMTWREDNKLLKVNDLGKVSQYYYDHSGNRAIKNAIGSDTLYPFATTVVTGAGSYTKHIFANNARMVTKVGNSIDTVMALGRPQEIQPAGDGVLKNWWYKYDQLVKKRTKNVKGFKPKKDHYQHELPKDDGDADWWHSENQLYFYHTDHLGSSSYLTNNNGEVHEYIAYTPHGESLIEQNGVGYNTPYQYTGKELDPTTNLYYYGARYYDPRTSVWQSTDPILDSYMWGSPNLGIYDAKNLGLYTYSYNNPVNITDPDGNTPAHAVRYVGGQVITRQLVKSGLKKAGQSLTTKDLAILAAGGLILVGGTIIGNDEVVNNGGGFIDDHFGINQPNIVLNESNDGKATAEVPEVPTTSSNSTTGSPNEPPEDPEEGDKLDQKEKPASEKYAKDIARRIERDLGKDARRDFHDMKESGAGDRTKTQLKQDAKDLYQDAGKELPNWLR